MPVEIAKKHLHQASQPLSAGTAALDEPERALGQRRRPAQGPFGLRPGQTPRLQAQGTRTRSSGRTSGSGRAAPVNLFAVVSRTAAEARPPPARRLWSGCSGKRKASRAGGARASGGSPGRAPARSAAHAPAPGAASPRAGRRTSRGPGPEPGGSGVLFASLPAAAAAALGEPRGPLAPFSRGCRRSPGARPRRHGSAARPAAARGGAAPPPGSRCLTVPVPRGVRAARSATGLARADGGERRPDGGGCPFPPRPDQPPAEVSDYRVLSTDGRGLKQ